MVLNIQGNQTEPETTIGRFGLEKKDPTVGINLPEGLINDYFKTVQSSPDGSYPELPKETSTTEQITEPSTTSQTEKLFGKKPKLRPPSSIRPKRRPGSVSPINKILELNYLLEGKLDPKSKKSQILSGLSSLTENGRKAVQGFFDNAAGGASGLDPAKDYWCAAFVAHVLSELGADPLNPKSKPGSTERYDRLRADKYRNYGSEVKSLADAREGDIIVFDMRNNDGIGDHVAFYAGGRITSQGGTDPLTGENYINVVGGNQGAFNEVSIKENQPGYTMDNVVAIRRITYNDIDFDFTQEMAKQDPVFSKFIPKYASMSLLYDPDDDDTYSSFDEGGLAQDDQMGILGFSAQGVQQEVDKYVDKDAEPAKDITFKDAAKFVAELTPIIGDAMAAKEVYDELQKDDPNYFLAGALGGAAIIGLIPGIGDAAASAIRAGARKALDVGKRIEVDPDALGSLGGNIRLSSKASSKSVKQLEIPTLYRGLDNKEVKNKLEPRSGYNVFASTNPDVAAGYSGIDGEVVPFKVDADKIIEFTQDPPPSARVPFNKFEFDRRAKLLGKGEVLVARNVVDAGPRGDSSTGLNYTALSDVYAIGKGTPTRQTYSARPVNYAEDLAEAEKLIESDELLEQWRKENGGKGQRLENPAEKDAEAFYQGDITRKELQTLINSKLGDPRLFTLEDFPDMPTITDTVGGMGTKARRYGILGVKGKDGKRFDLEEGQRVGSRLDIPAYNEYDKWIVSIHDGTKDKGGVLGYGQAIRLKNIEFKSDPKMALDIARKKELKAADPETGKGAKYQTKATIARIHGDYVKEDPYELYEQAKLLLDDPEWTQVGMNPYRGSFFYDKKTGMPVLNAEEIIQVGPLVLAKKVQTPKLSELKKYFGGEFKDGMYQSAARTKDGKVKVFNQGGTAMKDQMQMAFKDDGMTKDPVSGNEIPPGSLAKEVRDDIPAMLSEGEYVVPADVLRYYGVNFFENLRNQAKSGLQNMEAAGRIGGEPLSSDQVQQNMSGQPMTNAPPAQPVAANTGPAMLGQQSQTGTNTATTGQAVQNPFTPMNFSTVGFSQYQQPTQKPTSVTSTKTYVNATNTSDIKIVTYVNGVVTPPTDVKFTQPPYYLQGSPALAEAIEGAPKGGSGGGGGSPPDTDPPDPNAWARDITDPLAWAKENLQTEGKSVLELGVSVARTRALAIAAEAEGLDDLAFELRKEARAVVDEKKLLQLVPEGGMNGTVYASPLQKDKDLINSIFSIKDKKIVPSKDPKDPANMFPDRRTPTVSVTAKKDDKGKTNITSDKESSQTAANILKDLQEEKDNIIASSTTPSETAANISQLETALSASSQNPSGQISLKEGGLMQRKKKKGK